MVGRNLRRSFVAVASGLIYGFEMAGQRSIRTCEVAAPPYTVRVLHMAES